MIFKITIGSWIGIALLFQQTAFADSHDWQVKTDAQAMYGVYNASILRKDITSAGLMLSADYLETGGVTLGAMATQLNFNDTTTLNQQALYISLRKHSYFDALSGPLSLRVDTHLINNDDPTNSTSATVVASVLSFSNYDKTFYIDTGYAYSMYPQELSIEQWTPTFGFSFGQSSHWIQLRGYFIKPSNSLLAQNKSETSAIEMKWTHWLAPTTGLSLEHVQLIALGGERIYAVDYDSAAVYNVSDIQQGTLAVSSQWRLSESTHLIFAAGQELYTNATLSNNYNNTYAYLNISSQW